MKSVAALAVALVVVTAVAGLANKSATWSPSSNWLSERSKVTNGEFLVPCVGNMLSTDKGMTPMRIAVIEHGRLLIGFSSERLRKMHEGDVSQLRGALTSCTTVVLGRESADAKAFRADPTSEEVALRKLVQIRGGQTEDDPEFQIVGNTLREISAH